MVTYFKPRIHKVSQFLKIKLIKNKWLEPQNINKTFTLNPYSSSSHFVHFA